MPALEPPVKRRRTRRVGQRSPDELEAEIQASLGACTEESCWSVSEETLRHENFNQPSESFRKYEEKCGSIHLGKCLLTCCNKPSKSFSEHMKTDKLDFSLDQEQFDKEVCWRGLKAWAEWYLSQEK